MMILTVDTTGDSVELLLADGDKRWRARAKGARDHDEKMFSLLDSLLKRAKRKKEELGGVIAVSGPGSFTGIRVGLTFASILSKSLGAPAVGVSWLQTRAWRASKGQRIGKAIEVAHPGRKGELFLQTFRVTSDAIEADGEPTWKTDPRAVEPIAVQDALDLGAALLERGGKLPLAPFYVKPAYYDRAPGPASK